ncbi:unnamed protein product [Symbiodinium sp. KB8]|nr:unnamed protein product [Symbiodinium sp. KB8]
MRVDLAFDPRSMAYTTIREAWDAIPAVRECMRHSQTLVCRSDGEPENSPCNKSIANARLNEAVLQPYLLKMYESNLKLPTIDTVLTEVHEFYSMCRVQKDATILYNQAWSLRRLLQLVKDSSLQCMVATLLGFRVEDVEEMVGTWATIRESIGLQHGASSRSSLGSAAVADDDEEAVDVPTRPVARPLAGSTVELVRRAADVLERLGISDDDDEDMDVGAEAAEEGGEVEASDEPQEAHEVAEPSGSSGGPNGVLALKEEEDDDDVCITAVNIEPCRVPKRPSEMTEAEIRERLGVVQREIKHRRMMDLKGSFSRGNALRLARLRAMETTGGTVEPLATAPPCRCLDNDETQLWEKDDEPNTVPALQPERVKPFPPVEAGYVTRRDQFKLRDGLVTADPSAEAKDTKDLRDALPSDPARSRRKSKKTRKPKRGKGKASAAAEPTPKKSTKPKKTKAVKKGKKATVAEDESAEPASSNPPAAVPKAKAKAKSARKPKGTEAAAPVKDKAALEDDSKQKAARIRLPTMGYEEPVADEAEATAALKDLFESCVAGEHLQIHQFESEAPCRASYYWTKEQCGLKVQAVGQSGCKAWKQLHYFSQWTPTGMAIWKSRKAGNSSVVEKRTVGDFKAMLMDVNNAVVNEM